MDATLFENKPYYPNSAIQEEKNKQEELRLDLPH